MASSKRIVRVDLPTEAFQHQPWEPEQLAENLRLLWLLDQVRERRLGHSKAAELSGLPVAQFLRLMGRHGITPFDYDEADLVAELSPLR